MASVALHSLMHGSQRIPDSAFEKIPVVGPKYFKEKQKEDDVKRKDRQDGRDRRRDLRDNPPSESDPYDSDQESEYERERRARRSHRRSERDGRRSHNRGYDSNPESPALTRGYDERPRGQDERSRGYNDVRSGKYDEAPRGYDNSPYFPPPPKIAIDEPQQHNQDLQDTAFVPRPYNPTEYNVEAGARDNYYAGHPQEQEPYTPPVGPPPSQQAGYVAPSNAPTRDPDAFSHSSISDRYRPANADMYAPSTAERQYSRGGSTRSRGDRGSPSPNFPSSAVAVRPPTTYYPSQESLSPGYRRYDDYSDDDEEERRPRRSSKSSKSRSKSRGSRSRSRVGDARDKAKDGFEKHKGELGAGALGVVAGGLLGREFGGKKGKNGNIGMAIGAALGGLGAGLYSKHQEKQKEKSRERSRSISMPRRDYGGYESY